MRKENNGWQPALRCVTRASAVWLPHLSLIEVHRRCMINTAAPFKPRPQTSRVQKVVREDYFKTPCMSDAKQLEISSLTGATGSLFTSEFYLLLSTRGERTINH